MFGLNIPIAYKLDSKGLNKAKHEISGFRETLKKGLELGGIALGAHEIFDIAKESVRAAQAEAISQRQLDMVLERSTKQHGKNSKSVEKYIIAASRATGVVRGKLRPAFSVLARTTNDTTKASNLLNKAMDISAATGKPLETVVRAVAKAYAGHDSTLRRLLPGIKDNQNAMAYATKTYADARLTLADPFARLSAAVDVAKEALGKALLPIVQNVVSEITKPGGLADSVTQFFDDMSNKKTAVGAAFGDLKQQIKDTGGQFGDFFKQFDPKNSDPMVGVLNAIKGFVQILPSLVAAFVGLKALGGLWKIAGGMVTFMESLGAALEYLMPILLGFMRGVGLPTLEAILIAVGLAGDTKLQTPEQANQARNAIQSSVRRNANQPLGFGASKNPLGMTTNNVTVNVHSADPQKVVDAIKVYTRQNGSSKKVLMDYPAKNFGN